MESWRQVLRPVAGRDGPSERSVGLPFTFGGCAPVGATPAPRMGEQGREVVRDWLKLDDRAVEELFPEVSV